MSKLQTIREKKKITRADITKNLTINTQKYNRVESGISEIDVNNALKVSKVLDENIFNLFDPYEITLTLQGQIRLLEVREKEYNLSPREFSKLLRVPLVRYKGLESIRDYTVNVYEFDNILEISDFKENYNKYINVVSYVVTD